MSLIGGWSSLVEPLYASSAATLPHTQLLAAQPHPGADVAFVQSRARYAPARVPSTPALLPSEPSSNVPWGMALVDRKSLHPYAPIDTRVRTAVPTSSRFFDTIFIVLISLGKG